MSQKGFKNASKGVYDLNSMSGGKFNVTDKKKFFEWLSNELVNKNYDYPFVPVYKDGLYTVLTFDFDFVGKYDGDVIEIINHTIDVVTNMFEEHDTSYIIEKNEGKDNYHVIFNKIFMSREDAEIVRKGIQATLVDAVGDVAKEFFDILPGKMLRISLTNKKESNTRYLKYDINRKKYTHFKTKALIKNYLLDTISSSELNKNFSPDNILTIEDISPELRQAFLVLKEQKKVVVNNDEPEINIEDLYVNTRESIYTIMGGFKDGYFNGFEEWKKLVMVLKNCGFYCDEIIHIIEQNIGKLSLSSKQENNAFYNNIDVDAPTTYRIGTLYYMLKEHNPSYYKSVCNPVEMMKLKLKYIKSMFKKEYPRKDIMNFNTDLFKYITKFSDKYDYQIKRAYFSEFYVYFNNSGDTLTKKYDRTTKKFSYAPIQQMKMDYLTYMKLVEVDDENDVGKYVKVLKKTPKFTNAIYMDEDFKRYNDLVFLPRGITDEEYEINDYNVFRGFGYKDIDESIEDEKEQEIIKENFKKFNEYIFNNICSKSYNTYIYLMKWLRDIIYNPTKKNGIAFVFYSREKQTGKGAFAEFLRKVVGMDNSIFSKLNKLLGDFDNNGDQSVLSIYDEITRKDFSLTAYNEIKSLITETEKEINKKHITMKKGKDYNRFIFITNELNSFNVVDSEENRFLYLLFEKINNKKDRDVMSKLLKEIYNNDVYVSMFGKLLEKIDCDWEDRNDWTTSRPITKAEKLVNSLSPVETFFKDIVLGTFPLDDYMARGTKIEPEYMTIETKVLYGLFKKYLEDKNTITKSYGFDTFENQVEIMLYNCITPFTEKRKKKYKISYKKLMEKLINLKILTEETVNIDKFRTRLIKDLDLDDEEAMPLCKNEMKKLDIIVKRENQKIKRIETKEATSNGKLLGEFLNKYV